VRELISGNRGGLADMLYGMSPFNTAGKIDQGLKSQYDAAVKEAAMIAKRKFPIQPKTLTVAQVNEIKKKYPNLNPMFYGLVENPNFKAQIEFVDVESKKAYKKFTYLIYPPATAASKFQYRKLEIYWLDEGGNVDSLNAAVKEGVTKSPRNKTFNYLLGKYATGNYRPKDIGLAVRAVVGAGLGGDRFSFKDSDVFNPWKKRLGSGNIGAVGIGSPDPVTGTVVVVGSYAWWSAALSKLAITFLTSLSIILVGWLANKLNPAPEVDEVVPGNGGGGGGGETKTDIAKFALPVGAAVAAYLLFFSDDKK
jgi:hypothetical protein